MAGGKMSTPLARVRGLGAAKSGTEHFWRQRLTAVANVPLTIAFVLILVSLLGRNHAAAAQVLGRTAMTLARGEGLTAHARSAEYRLNDR